MGDNRQAWVQVRTDGRQTARVAVNGQPLRIGRAPGNSIVLQDQFVSARHAEVIEHQGTRAVRDLGSSNGTLLNGVRLSGEMRLRPGDVVTLGEHVLTLAAEGAPPEEEDDVDLHGTQMFSARELSDIGTKPLDAEGLKRQNRVLGTAGDYRSEDYYDRALIAEELTHARQLCSRHGWPLIDVTRRSIEETAATIMNYYAKHVGAETG